MINTERGAIVNEEAMIETLIAGRIAGAGLNIFEAEPSTSGHPLARLENVVLTLRSVDNLWNFLDGRSAHVVISGGGAR